MEFLTDLPEAISSPGAMLLEGLSLPMILGNLSLEIEHLLPAEQVEATNEKCVHDVMNVFYNNEMGLIPEVLARVTAFLILL